MLHTAHNMEHLGPDSKKANVFKTKLEYLNEY